MMCHLEKRMGASHPLSLTMPVVDRQLRLFLDKAYLLVWLRKVFRMASLANVVDVVANILE
jgi:hypothetical protein